jgi:Arc/MetJ-type ribon-helix-helix transcriptional regulator
VKVSVSLPAEDVRFLDDYAQVQGLDSRSAALHRAVRLLRTMELREAYQSAWDEWVAEGEAEAWEPATRDGLGE